MPKNSSKVETVEETQVHEGTVDGTVVDKMDRSQFASGPEGNMNDGFLPYWEPEAGQEFCAIPVDFDDRQEGFARIVFEACEDIQCYTGPVEDQKPVTVRAGEKFNTSRYHGLQITPAFFGFLLRVVVTDKKRVQSDPKKSVFLWNVFPLAKDLPKLRAAKNDYAKMIAKVKANAQLNAQAQATANGGAQARA